MREDNIPHGVDSTLEVEHRAFVSRFPQGVDGFVQTDTAKFAIPFDYEGKIHWVEIAFVAKKDDFDPRKAEHDYQVKLQHGLEREQERHSKKMAKAKA